MRRYLVPLVALACAVWFVPTIADANHVTEPSAPITGIASLTVFKYPDLSTARACDNSDAAVTWGIGRIEPRVAHTGQPTEHFRVAVEWYRAPLNYVWPDTAIQNNPIADATGANPIVKWGTWTLWGHQNVPPHSPQAGVFQIGDGNTYFNGDTGSFLVRVIVKATPVTAQPQVVRATFIAGCQFKRVNP